MFKKIKEFIEAFKNAYNIINVIKIDAKKSIDEYSKEVDNIVYAADSLKIILARLEEIYDFFPIKERQDFIQKTLDLLRYGRNFAKGNLIELNGMTSLYDSNAKLAKKDLAHLKKLYKEGKYGEVKALAKEYLEGLEDFYVSYNIIDKPN